MYIIFIYKPANFLTQTHVLNFLICENAVFFSKCDQIVTKLWISSHSLKKSLMESLIFFAV